MSGDGPIVVAKVGGSLLGWADLPARLGRFLATRRGDRLVLVAGGGGAADWVRALDSTHSLGEEVSHALAVRSLDLTAHALAAIAPGLAVASTVADLGPIWRAGRVPVLAPRLSLEGEDALPRTWDSTTDSIAAILASRLGAAELVLLKSRGVPPGTTREEAARIGVVDPVFPSASRGVPSVVVLDLRGDEVCPLGAGASEVAS